MNYLPYFNQEEALKRIRGNEKLLKMMIKMFLTSKEVIQLEGSLDSRNIATAETMSHAVKGLAANLSFPLLYEISTKLNQELKEGMFNDETVAEYRRILTETQNTIKEVGGIE